MVECSRDFTNKEDLTILRDLMQAGKVTPVIDRHYKLSEVSEAIRYALHPTLLG